MKLPKFLPAPVRPEQEQPQGKEIFQPHWNCFCCHDTGKVQSHLVRLVIPDYNYDRDRLPVCQLSSCGLGTNFLHLEDSVDMRFNAAICQELDRISREDWRQSVENWFATAKQRLEQKTKEIATVANLRHGDRTQEECVFALSNHSKARGDWEIIEEEEEVFE